MFYKTNHFRHEGPVWQVSWAHPKFGSILASCSYDGTVIIWEEEKAAVGGPQKNIDQSSTTWKKLKIHRAHESSVNSISFAPYEFGLKLVCASSDGKISVLSYDEGGEWKCSEPFLAHNSGCNSVSWCPSTIPSSLLALNFNVIDQESIALGPQRIATGGCDNCVKLWKLNVETDKWELEDTLVGHSDWVRDVCWRPNIGLSGHLLVSCSQDNYVLLWRQALGKWESKPLKAEPFPDTLWRVSFSEYGHLLAVSCGDNTVTIWKEIPDEGTWEIVGTVDENVTETVKISEPLAVSAPAALPVPDISFSSTTGPELKVVNDAGYIKPMSPIIPLMANATQSTGYQQTTEDYDSYQHAQTPTFYQCGAYNNIATTYNDQHPTTSQNHGYEAVNEEQQVQFNKDIGFIPNSMQTYPTADTHQMHPEQQADNEPVYSTEYMQLYEQSVEQKYEQPIEQLADQTYWQNNEQQNYDQGQSAEQSYQNYAYGEQEPAYSIEQTSNYEQPTDQTYNQVTEYNYDYSPDHVYATQNTDEYSFDKSAEYQQYDQSTEPQNYGQTIENQNYEQHGYGQEFEVQAYDQAPQQYSYDSSTYQEPIYQQETHIESTNPEAQNDPLYNEYTPPVQYEQGSTETDFSAQALQYEGYQSTTQSSDSYANQF